MLAEIKDAVTPAVAGYSVNGTTFTVGAVIEQYAMIFIAILGLILTVWFQCRQDKRDRLRLKMDEEEHDAREEAKEPVDNKF